MPAKHCSTPGVRVESDGLTSHGGKTASPCDGEQESDVFESCCVVLKWIFDHGLNYGFENVNEDMI